MTTNMEPHPSILRLAVIYCRVAAIGQTRDASDFQNQEDSCRAYAAAKGYDVQAVFSDYANSQSGVAKRPRLKALMSYLKAHQNEAVVVITVDPARLSRDVGSQARLRARIEALGAIIEHPGQSSGAATTDGLRSLMLDIYAEEERKSRKRRREAAKK